MEKNQKAKMELLAPAGSEECILPAVRCGCDAVYLGASHFSARGSAKNFDNDALLRTVTYCHERGVKVYLALNTLIRDDEMKAALSLVEYACSIGIDALIVQDIGLVRHVRKAAPALRLHASTQMSVHTPSGVRFLAQEGFSRVVLSRELSLSEIKEIAKTSPVELEVFVHGALCMSVSGQCYFSSVLGGRSGNRGLCAQPCRLPFAAPGGTGHDLSLKDLSLIGQLAELQAAGVASAKIEGRMKRPEYVAAAVFACRLAMDGAPIPTSLQENLQAVFSRGGFTQGYYFGKLGKEMFGIRSRDDVLSAGNTVFSELHSLYRKERKSVPVDFSFSLLPGKPCRLWGRDDKGNCASFEGMVPEPAVQKPLDKEKIQTQLGKTGGSPFFLSSLDITSVPGLSLPLSELNRLRRLVLDELLRMRGRSHPIPFQKLNFSTPGVENVEKSFFRYACFSDIHQVPEEAKSCGMIFLPLSTSVEELSALSARGFSLGIELPRVFFGREEAVRTKLKQLWDMDIRHARVGNWGALALAQELGFFCHGAFGLNLFNTSSLEFCREHGLIDAEISFELSLAQARALGGSLPRGILTYGRLPMMLTRNCPIKNGVGQCKKCHKNGSLTDRRGISFPVRCDGFSSEVLNSVPLFLLDGQNSYSDLDFEILRFTVENSVEIGEILRSSVAELKNKFQYTRGLSARGIE